MADEIKENQAPDETAARLVALRPLIHEILRFVANADLPVGNNSEEEDNKYFPVAEEILRKLNRDGIMYIEKETVFQLLLQVIDKLKTIVIGSLQKSFNKAMDIKFGKEFDQISVTDIDETLKNSAPAKKIPVV